jgi:predicted secreted protein
MGQRPISGVGTKFRKWDGVQWTDVAQVMSITGPGLTKETIDVTNLDSVGGYREFIGSFRDGGDVALNMNYTRAGFDAMKADYDAECPVDYEIVLPDGNRDNPSCTTSIDESKNTTFQFKGVVTEMPIAITTDNQVTMDVTIKVSGKVYVNDGEESTAPTYV